MAAKKIVFTPPMVAFKAHFNEPDTYTDPTSGVTKTEYKGKLRGDMSKDPAVKAWFQKQKADAKELGIEKITKATNLLMKRLDSDQVDDDGEAIPGTEVQLIAKSNYKPLFVQPNGKPYPAGQEPLIGDGSIVVCKLSLSTYAKGVSSYMEAVQVIKLVKGTPGGGKASADGFGSYSDDEDEDDQDDTDQSDFGNHGDDDGGVDI